MLRRIARHDRDASGLDELARLDFRAHPADYRCRRSDEHETGTCAGVCKRGVLGQEAITGMHGIGLRLSRRIDDPGNRQIALTGPRRPNRHRAIGGNDMRRPAVSVRVDSDAFDTELATGANDADGDLSAVCDQQTVDHRNLEFGIWNLECVSSFDIGMTRNLERVYEFQIPNSKFQIARSPMSACAFQGMLSALPVPPPRCAARRSLAPSPPRRPQPTASRPGESALWPRRSPRVPLSGARSRSERRPHPAGRPARPHAPGQSRAPWRRGTWRL